MAHYLPSHLLLSLILCLSTSFHASGLSGSSQLTPFASSSLLAGFEVAALSIPGTDPDRPQKVNQDDYFTFSASGMVGIGVMDGHGLRGHELTAYLRRQLPLRLEEQFNNDGTIPVDSVDVLKRFRKNLKELSNFVDEDHGHESVDAEFALVRLCFQNAFELAHVDALECKGIPAGRSGATCVIAAVSNANVLYTAIVGDSRAVLVDRATLSTRALTTETTTKLPEERKRIEKGEGRMDDLGNVYYGPVGIAMTRSLGNGVLLRAGVVPTPVVNIHGTLPEDSTVVLGTDGIFDVVDIKSDNFSSHILKQSTLEESIVDLCQIAKGLWRGDLPVEGKVDDITGIAFRRCVCYKEQTLV